MNEIRAFVGHSFLESDTTVVDAFLKYFDRLSNLIPGFSWEHAEAAEPKQLTEKVLSILPGKNVFIGICTKREQVIEGGLLSRGLIRTTTLSAREDKFLWKTSDWIIQEIGLAIGRGLTIILLIESGVRKPGGLQGDVEYIEFDPQGPEKSFGKILEMLSALSPKAVGVLAAFPEAQSTLEEGKIDAVRLEIDDWLNPKPEWSRGNYEFAYRHTKLVGDEAQAAKVNEAYLASNEVDKDENKVSWQAYCEYCRVRFGENGDFGTLKAFADAHPKNSRILSYLAGAYQKYEDSAQAARTYEIAAWEEPDSDNALNFLGNAAVAYLQADMSANALAVVGDMKARVETNKLGELRLLETLKELAEIAKDTETSLGTMERIVEINPSDSSTKFDLAYKHSENENGDIALFHYLRIPYKERHTGTWNNLGVSYDSFSLPAKSVSAYRKAEEMGETLAMSNLANKLLSAGFLSEAQKQLDVALAKDDYHKNVGLSLAKLKDVKNRENTKEAEVLSAARPKSEFYKEFGRAISKSELTAFPEKWEGQNFLLTAKLTGSEFIAEGTYDQAAGLFAALGGASVRYLVKYKGILRGRSIKARVKRAKDGDKSSFSLLGSDDSESDALMIFSDDGNELRVMEKSKSAGSRFYTLKRA